MSIEYVREVIEANNGEWDEYLDVDRLQDRAIELLIELHPELKPSPGSNMELDISDVDENDLYQWCVEAMHAAASEVGLWPITRSEDYVMYYGNGVFAGAWLNGRSLLPGDQMGFDDVGHLADWIPEEFGGNMSEYREELHNLTYDCNYKFRW